MTSTSTMRRFALVTLAAAAVALAAVSCGDSATDPEPPPESSVASVSVSPAEDSIAAGETTQFSASAEDADGTSVSADFSWSSTNSSVATVDDQGVATAQAAGAAEIVASAGSVADSAELTVTESSATAASIQSVSGGEQNGVTGRAFDQPLVVEARDDSGDPVSGVSISWSVTSGDASPASGSTVTGSDGRASVEVTAGPSTGSVTVEASASGADGSPVSFALETTVARFAVGDFYFEDPQGRQNTDAAVEMAVGDTVMWEWGGSAQHNVQSGEGQGGSSGDGVPQGGATLGSPTQTSGTYRFAPQVEGTWEFYCGVHPSQMYGSTFTVTGGASSSVTTDGPGYADLEPGDEIRPEGSHIVFVYRGPPGSER